MRGHSAGLEFQQCGGSVHLRHHHVQKDSVWLLGAGAFDPLLAGIRQHHVPPRHRFQAHGRHLADIVFVVNDQDAACHKSTNPPNFLWSSSESINLMRLSRATYRKSGSVEVSKHWEKRSHPIPAVLRYLRLIAAASIAPTSQHPAAGPAPWRGTLYSPA